MSVESIFWVVLGLSAIAGFGMAVGARGTLIYERVMRGIFPALLVVVAMVLMVNTALALYRPWNNARLAPSQALLEGYGIYYGDSGPLLGTMYTPGAYLCYLPAVLFGTPSKAVVAGVVMTILFIFTPTIAILAVGCRRKGLPVEWSVGIGLLIILTAMNEIGFPGFWIHVDHPALAMFLGSIGIVYFMRANARPEAIVLAAGLLVGAVFCKQTYAAGVPGVLVMGWVLHGRETAIRLAVATGVFGMVVSLVLAIGFDFSAFWLNAVKLPSAQRWNVHGVKIVLYGVEAVGASVSISWFLLAVYVAIGRWTTQGAVEPAQGRWLERHRWAVLGIPAAFIVPMGFVGMVKVGGDWNHITPIGALVTLAMALLMIDRIGESRTAGKLNWARALALVLPILLLCIEGTALVVKEHANINVAWGSYSDNPERRAFEMAQKFPGKIYFPFHPLTTLKTEGVAYHLSDAVANRMIASIPISSKQFEDGIPPDLTVIAIYGESDPIQQYMPEFKQRMTDPSMPGWTLWVRPKGMGPSMTRP